MDNINEEILNNEETDTNDVASEEMIKKCAEMIAKAIEDDNTERLKGILAACTVDLHMSDEEIDELVETTKKGLNGELDDDEISEISGGSNLIPGPLNGPKKYLAIAALATVVLTPITVYFKEPIKKNLAKIKDKITGKK